MSMYSERCLKIKVVERLNDHIKVSGIGYLLVTLLGSVKNSRCAFAILSCGWTIWYFIDRYLSVRSLVNVLSKGFVYDCSDRYSRHEHLRWVRHSVYILFNFFKNDSFLPTFTLSNLRLMFPIPFLQRNGPDYVYV